MRIRKNPDSEWLEGKLDGMGIKWGDLISATPELSQVFEAFTSNRKHLTIAELNLSLQKEKNIPAGYSSAYTRGMPEVLEFIEVGKRLGELKVNPLKTHIDYFAVQIEKYIVHIREGILSQRDVSVELTRQALDKLEGLEAKAFQAKREKKVTYKWWLEFNRDLSMVASPLGIELRDTFIKEHITRIKKGILFQKDLSAELTNQAFSKIERLEAKALQAEQEKRVTYKWWLEFNRDLSLLASSLGIELRDNFLDTAFIYQFPLSIVFPTITGELGVMALNRAFPQGIYPVGLVNEPKTVDGQTGVSPYGFLRHDLDHIEGADMRDQSYNSEAYRQFHNRLMKVKESLPLEKRKNIEIAYSALIHEDRITLLFIEDPSEKIRNFIYNSLKQQQEQNFNFKGLIDDWNDKEKLTQQLEIIAEDFRNIFSQIKNE